MLASGHLDKFLIGGSWVKASGAGRLAVIDPYSEQPFADIAMGEAKDVDLAVAAARQAFRGFARSLPAERRNLLKRILAVYESRLDELARLLSVEMGGPLRRTRGYQVEAGREHLREIIRVMDHYPFRERRGGTLILREPVGVCGLITPWNAPIGQILSKVAPAIAAGCTMVLKPSEVSPLSAILLAEVMQEAGTPAGVFNLVQGDGAAVGVALSHHPDIDMMSFTGSTRAGIRVAQAAAETVKRVHQELGGKSANILLPDVDVEAAVRQGVLGCYGNSGQSCIAPCRLLVPAALHDRAIAAAKQTAENIKLGDPLDLATDLGPLVSAQQYRRVQQLIEAGIAEGARLVTGGTGRPNHLPQGYFVRPTIFADVTPDMRIARDEIFGPVLTIHRYGDIEDAISLANDTPYGLAAYVQSQDAGQADYVASRLRAGCVYVNYTAPDYGAPFGGYGQSGNGREYGEWGLEAFIELKSVVGIGN